MVRRECCFPSKFALLEGGVCKFLGIMKRVEGSIQTFITVTIRGSTKKLLVLSRAIGVPLEVVNLQI